MYVIAFILAIFGISKILMSLSITKKEINNLVGEIPSEYQNTIILILGTILLDGLLELVCGLFVIYGT